MVTIYDMNGRLLSRTKLAEAAAGVPLDRFAGRCVIARIESDRYIADHVVVAP
jgi:hypothetical protein